MRPGKGALSIKKLKLALSAFAMIGLVILSSCNKKQDGYLLAATKVTSVIQINANTTAYSISSAPDVISFSIGAVSSTAPNLREYLVKGITTNSNVSFSLAFHIDSVGSGQYIMEGSQLIIGSKSYISLASKSADKVAVSKIDNTNKAYAGTFSFYSFNQSSATDSILVTGTYSIQ